MKPLIHRAVTALVSTTAVVLVVGSAWGSTCAPNPTSAPLCVAQAGDKVCNNDSSRQCAVNADCTGGGTCVSSGLTTIGVTVTPFSGQSITSVAVTGSPNLVTIPASVSGGVNQVVTFRVRQTTTTQDDLGTAIANQSNGTSCTVDLTFDYRAVAGSTPQTVCALSGGYTLDVINSLPSPAGTTACSSHIGNCTETPNLPAGYDWQTSDSRVLSIHSPISGPNVDMQMTRAGGFLSTLRLMYSHFSGSSFGTYADITYAVVPGSTIIRGTGQWSDVKLVAANTLSPGTPNLVPTVSEWGLAIMSLLLLTASTVLLTRRRLAVSSGASLDSGPPIVAPALLGKVAAAIGVLGVLSLAVAVRLGYAPSATDATGALLCAGILAYLLHYWIALTRDDGKGGPH